MSELAERLGHRDDARLVIVSCDDLGACHAANVGVYHALREGVATCSSIMVPAPWARDAAARYRGEDIGVHLTLVAEHELYRWGPITHAPSLLSGEGGFPRRIDDLWEHADVDEVRRECRAQIERAVVWGFDVSHLSSHLSALTLRPELFDVLIDLALEFRLPVRLPSSVSEQEAGFPFRTLAAEEGVVFPDHFVAARRWGSRDRVEATVDSLEPGVTEIHLQPAVDTPEVRALAPDHWPAWVDDLALVSRDGPLAVALRDAGAVPIGFRALRALMRDR
jgi:predicted glycoside hydrolase/deacetylase ChbG (UPF0249 family)